MRHVANLKNLLFNKINVLIMKKLLFSALFLTAFSSGLFAKQEAETPVSGISCVISNEKKDTEVIVLEECTNVSFQYCGDWGQATWTGTICSDTLEDVLDYVDEVSNC
jgi:hypothetical protein